MGGRPSMLRVVLAVVAIVALATATWLTVVGRRQAHRASALRQANSVAMAGNRALSKQLSGLAASNSRMQGRIARIDGDRGATIARMDALIGAWNEWHTATNALIQTTNGLVDEAGGPSATKVRTSLDPRLRVVTEKEAAFRDAVAKFTAAAAIARHDASGDKP